ncbi:hypothetical protein ACCS81_32115, partial [Rhizobium ruizarguesonis]
YSAMKSARALGFATSRHLHHVPGHDPCFASEKMVITPLACSRRVKIALISALYAIHAQTKDGS